MKLIPLTQGKFAKVSDEDFGEINAHKWYYLKRGYAIRLLPTVDGKRKMVFMHREILRTPRGFETDHINGDKLDNRRENLRACTASENQRNRGITKKNKSGYKGVDWQARDKKWRAKIHIHKKDIHLGLFDNPIDAACAYDEAAKTHFGIFARLNFE